MFRATAIKKALKSAASRLTPRENGFQATRRNMSGGGSIEEEIGKKKSIIISSFPETHLMNARSLLSLMMTDICKSSFVVD